MGLNYSPLPNADYDSNLSICSKCGQFHDFVTEIISDRTSRRLHVTRRKSVRQAVRWSTIGQKRRRTPGRNYCHRNAVTLSLFSGRSRRGRRWLYWPRFDCSFERRWLGVHCAVVRLTQSTSASAVERANDHALTSLSTTSLTTTSWRCGDKRRFLTCGRMGTNT